MKYVYIDGDDIGLQIEKALLTGDEAGLQAVNQAVSHAIGEITDYLTAHGCHIIFSGADGVMVAGCDEGSCHFIQGNLRAKKRVQYAKELLEEVGINPERLEMYHIAASQGPLFARRSREFTEKIINLNAVCSGESDSSSENNQPME